MIGDSETDFMTAVNAKVPSIIFTFGYSDRPVTELAADAVLDHYRYLPEAVRKVTGQAL
jgi:phosphoglycolate phosphatase